MENVEMEIRDGKLIITVDMSQELGLSKSQKSMKIATTGGNVKIPHTDAVIGLNVYRKA